MLSLGFEPPSPESNKGAHEVKHLSKASPGSTYTVDPETLEKVRSAMEAIVSTCTLGA